MKPESRRTPLAARALPGIATAALLAAALGCGSDRPPVSAMSPARPSHVTLALPVKAGTRDVVVELAVTEEERNAGLMNRTSLEPDAGMLFLFATDQTRRFWMRNTLIPLDILFLDADGTVQNITAGQPGVEQPGYLSLRPARMVLELNQGWCQEHGLTPGSKVPVPPELLTLPKT